MFYIGVELINNIVLVSGEWDGGVYWEFGIDMYSLLGLKWITNKYLLRSTGSSAEYSVN